MDIQEPQLGHKFIKTDFDYLNELEVLEKAIFKLKK